LDRIGERLSRIEGELFDEFSELARKSLRKSKEIIEAYEKGGLETITLEELKRNLKLMTNFEIILNEENSESFLKFTSKEKRSSSLKSTKENRVYD